MVKSGKLVVFEGADGSGKTTQSKLLRAELKKRKILHGYVSFPRYESSLWAKQIRRFLLGEMGQRVDPYFSSTLYAGDRLSVRDEICNWLDAGKLVVCNRYVGSNIGHMGAKFEKLDEKKKYIDWLERLEYDENKIPKEDLVIYLRVPIKVAQKLMHKRELDIHESNIAYQQRVIETYDSYSKSKKNWVVIDCTQNNHIIEPYQIHQKVLEILKGRKIL